MDTPSLLLHHTSLSCRTEDEALKVSISASGGTFLTTKPGIMDALSVQQRPDKASPCPRCQSLDTKFCYFNNHNAKQPRHFCRKCQRYWTAGGALRNVPVGAGRRKQKTPLISTPSKSHLEEINYGLASASGMCYPSSQGVHFATPRTHMDGIRPHSFQCVAAMSTHEQDGSNACESLSQAVVHKPVNILCVDTQSDARQKEEGLRYLQNHGGAFNGEQNGARQVQSSPFTEALPCSHNEKAEDQAPLPLSSHRSTEVEKMEVESSSSASTCPPALDRRVAHPLVWLEQLAKANTLATTESMQRAYGYGNASFAWSHPFMSPWLMPYATNNGPTCSPADRAAVSAAWASAVTATAANLLHTSPLWNPYGWVRDGNKSEGLSLLGKHGRSSAHEQEPLCVPKTLKIGDPEEAMHSSILMTLGLSSLSTSSPASVAGFFNASLQDVPQHKPRVDFTQRYCEQQRRTHANPAAEARAVAFQESS